MMEETHNHAFDFGFEISGLDAQGNVTAPQLREALLARVLRISDEELLEACDSFDSHPDSQGKAVGMDLLTNDQLIHSLRLLRVTYGDDRGLVSLVLGRVLAQADETVNFYNMRGCPHVSIDHAELEPVYGYEHSWNDVVDVLREHYDWDTKNLLLDNLKNYANQNKESL